MQRRKGNKTAFIFSCALIHSGISRFHANIGDHEDNQDDDDDYDDDDGDGDDDDDDDDGDGDDNDEVFLPGALLALPPNAKMRSPIMDTHSISY